MAQEIVEVRGHLIDSRILPGILDVIMAHEGRFEVQRFDVGATAEDSSFARLLLTHDSPKKLETILQAVARLGAQPVERRPVTLKPAPRDGVFPEGFYVTTNLPTSVYLGGRWVRVKNPQMDSGIVVSESPRSARTLKMADVRKGDRIVVGRGGVHVTPPAPRRGPGEFGFMTSDVSTEKPKRVLIAHVAAMLRQEREAGRPVLWVCGPALVHSGAGPLFEKLIAAGYVQVLFSGNALAVHDVECALMGTSLGVSMREGAVTRAGHENHLRSINAIRQAGGIRAAVRTGLLHSGIMHACVTHGVDFVLAGSIRDDGPLPDVITDSVQAQHQMRRRCRKVGLAIMVATLLHSVATGNMLPASTRVVCVDIQPAAVTKLADRGTAQALGIVTDVQPFLQSLLLELG
ncbi:MAG: TIGR00300 family protein [Candidatus Brocadiaceae bacterium]|nr:TIGR00300 family protein [Candidatus Brocadiaceae bacterium]